MTLNTQNNVLKSVEGARDRLLDLTFRNRLLNFRPSKRKSLLVLHPSWSRIYEHLILNEKEFGFTEKPAEKILGTAKSTDTSKHDLTSKSKSETRSGRLVVDVSEGTLRDVLFSISNQARSALEEQGYTVLYLALGFLQWKESENSEQQRTSPLILIPVEISRTEVRSEYRVSWTGEDVGANLSLMHKMTEFNIVLPALESWDSLEDVTAYFDNVRKAISKKHSWSITDAVYLGFFSFMKFIMYKDLDSKEWPPGQGPESHPLIQALFAPQENSDVNDRFLTEDEIDDRVNWDHTHYVLDADPSQIVAIEAAKAGHNLVVEGPPGTGKSQTIANIIGELLAEERTVLFVSEKMAALEVVKSRLDRIGLGEFCLELHSRKARKSEVIAELERCVNEQHAYNSEPGRADRMDLLRRINELDEYATALREPYGSMKYSPYALFEMRERSLASLSKSEHVDVCSKVKVDGEWTSNRISRIKEKLLQLSDLLHLMGPIDKSPWSCCDPNLMSPSDIENLHSRLLNLRSDLHEIKTLWAEVSEKLGIISEETLSNTEKITAILKLLSNRPRIHSSLLPSLNWNDKTIDSLLVSISIISNIRTLRNADLQIFKEEALETDVSDLYKKMSSIHTSPLSFLKKEYRACAREASKLYKEPRSLFYKKYLSDLQSLLRYQIGRNSLDQKGNVFRPVLGDLWQGEASDTEELEQVASWIADFVACLKSGTCTKETASALEALSTEYYITLLNKFLELAHRITGSLDEVFTTINCDAERIFASEIGTVSLSLIERIISKWADSRSIEQLQIWARYKTARKNDSLKDVLSLVQLLENREITESDIGPCLECAIAELELQKALDDWPILGTFVGKVHEGKIERFQRLDREIIEANQELVCAKLRDKRPMLTGGLSRDSQGGILLREINKKRRHLPIRKLMAQAGGLIQKYKPCFMMSPLSIAQFLDPKITQFDVVIFDEASQVRPEDALGALLRGKQAVIMGDTKQLPPTSFFDHFAEDLEEDEDADSVSDIESILHLCRRSFPSKNLKWHYRSRHETLIAVSNEEFYDNKLVVYPSPMQDVDDLGLKLVHLPNTIYDRGRTAQNRQEALAVARAAIQHFRESPERSLGVGTFSAKQQTAILEELEHELDEHPEMAGYFSQDRDEHFFVKNLETIQGDERDVIYLSIGYGFDRYGKLSNNFGPLNSKGGERRLNVLITRAREKCVVFSNFRADDLRANGRSPKGLRSLKTFLQFAETRVLRSIQNEVRDSDSPFEDAVRDFLQSEGFEVHKQVGSAGYRIDLALPDPKSPGKYLLGIECDGAKYHSSRVARERDRLRQEVLERLGWRIYRVWSTDWYTQRRTAQDQLLKAVKEALSPSPQMPIKKSPQRTNRSRKRNLKKEKHAQAQKIKTNEESGTDTPMSKRPSIAAQSPHYEECKDLSIQIMNPIPRTPRSSLAQGVVDVVSIEGPIHINEVIRRIRSLWGLKRSGGAIQEAIIRGVEFACDQVLIQCKGKFLWPINGKEIKARYRDDPHILNIDLICDEELKEAVKSALRLQYATPKETLSVISARYLGFRQTSTAIRERIADVVEDMLSEEQLVQLPNGMLDISQNANTRAVPPEEHISKV